ncbi:MAG TPA: hypothetical protein VLE72_03885 [Candidatus Saccharimonadales bacterium]|nr:hypothetical protein [Candidatus Saccharimonadales bacterium]
MKATDRKSLIRRIADSGRLDAGEVAQLRSLDREVHYFLLELERRVGLNRDSGATVAGGLRCRASSRHDLDPVLNILPQRVTAGLRETWRCNDCGSIRHTVTDSLGQIQGHDYDYSETYELIKGAVTRAEARRLQTALNWDARLERLAKRLQSQGRPAKRRPNRSLHLVASAS